MTTDYSKQKVCLRVADAVGFCVTFVGNDVIWLVSVEETELVVSVWASDTSEPCVLSGSCVDCEGEMSGSCVDTEGEMWGSWVVVSIEKIESKSKIL